MRKREKNLLKENERKQLTEKEGAKAQPTEERERKKTLLKRRRQ